MSMGVGLTFMYTYDHDMKPNSILPPHLFSSKYSVEKCDELLAIGFYGKVGNLNTNKINSIEEQLYMYNDCIVIAKHINNNQS